MTDSGNIFDFSKAKPPCPCPKCHGRGFYYRAKLPPFVLPTTQDEEPKIAPPLEKEKCLCETCRGRGY